MASREWPCCFQFLHFPSVAATQVGSREGREAADLRDAMGVGGDGCGSAVWGDLDVIAVWPWACY